MGRRVRTAVHGRFQDGIASKRVVIVGVFVALGDREDPLAQQLRLEMAHPGRVARVDHRAVHPLDQPDAQVDLPQEQTARIGAHLAVIKGGDEALGSKACEGELLMTDCRQRALLFFKCFL